MAADLAMLGFVVIGLTTLATAVVGVGLPRAQRLASVLPLIAGAGAGVASLAIAMIVIPDSADDTSYSTAFLISSVVGALVVGVALGRLVRRASEG